MATPGNQVSVVPFGDQIVAAAGTAVLVVVPLANAVYGVNFVVKVTALPGTVLDLIVATSPDGTTFTPITLRPFAIRKNGESSNLTSAVTTGYLVLTGVALNDVYEVYVPIDARLANNITHLRLSAHNGGGTAITIAVAAAADGVSYT